MDFGDHVAPAVGVTRSACHVNISPMPKNSHRKEAALRRERDKRGEIDPKEADELAQDGNYIPGDASVNLDVPPTNSDTDLTPSQLGERITKAQELVPEALDQVSVANIRRYFRRCFHYMDAYR